MTVDVPPSFSGLSIPQGGDGRMTAGEVSFPVL